MITPRAPHHYEIPASQLELPLCAAIDAAQSNHLLMAARRRALEITQQRIRAAENITQDESPPARRQGAPRAIRDLDDIDALTGQPRLYKTASAAAAALHVTRAHHVLRAAARNGRAGGHRVCTDAHFRAGRVQLPVACCNPLQRSHIRRRASVAA